MKYYCGKIGETDSLAVEWTKMIKHYNPILNDKDEISLSNFWLRTYSESQVNSEAEIDFDSENQYIYIDGYVILKGVCYSNQSSTEEKRMLYKYIKNVINGHKYGEFNNLCGSFLIIFFTEQHIAFISDNITSRQLYYSLTEKSLIFSNDLRILLCNKDVKFEINEQKCRAFCSSNYSVLESDNDSQTFFENVYKIESGSVLISKFGRNVRKINYFKKYKINQIHYINGDCNKEFRKNINYVIQCAVNNTNGNIGVSLSGGIDSAVVLASLVDLGYKDRIIAYHVSFRDTNLHQSSDYKLVTTLIHDMGIKGRILYADNCLRFKNSGIFEDNISFINGPALIGSEISYDLLSPIMKNDGVELLFTGDGGDYMFMGTKYCGDYFMKKLDFHEALRRSRRLANNTKLTGRLKSFFLYNIVPLIPVVQNAVYKSIFWGDVVVNTPEYIRPEIEKTTCKHKKITLSSSGKHINTWYRKFVFDFMFPKAPYVEVNVDSFSFSLPLEDNLIFKTVMAIPPHCHYDIYRGWQGEYRIRKKVLRDSFSDILPQYITKQINKTNYASMFRHMLKTDYRNIYELICGDRELFCSKLGIVYENLFKSKIRSVLDMAFDANFNGGDDINYYMNIIKLEIWLVLVSYGKDKFLKHAEIGKLYTGFTDIEEV